MLVSMSARKKLVRVLVRTHARVPPPRPIPPYHPAEDPTSKVGRRPLKLAQRLAERTSTLPAFHPTSALASYNPFLRCSWISHMRGARLNRPAVRHPSHLHGCRRGDARQPGSLARAATQFSSALGPAQCRAHNQDPGQAAEPLNAYPLLPLPDAAAALPASRSLSCFRSYRKGQCACRHNSRRVSSAAPGRGPA